MSLLSWFRHTIPGPSSPRLEALVSKAADYLESRPPDSEFVPKIVGKAIGESELAATTALTILERQGVTKHHFGVYCSNTEVPLDSFDDLSEIQANRYYCEICDEDHFLDDGTCKVEVYFTIESPALSRYLRKSAA
jgi:hypothetical protein